MMPRTMNAAANRLQRGRFERVLGGPTDVIAHVTDTCTLACAMCMNASEPPEWPSEAWHEPSDDMTPAVLRRLLARFPTARSICFAGVGEPLAVDEMEEMVRLAHEAGLKTSLVSNGTLLAANSGWITSGILDSLDVSVNAHDVDTMRKVCGKDGKALDALRRGVAAIVSSRRAPLDVTMSAVLWKGRQDEAHRLLEFAAGLGIRDVHFHNLIPSSRPGCGPERMLTPSDRGWVRSLGEEGERLGLHVSPPMLLDPTLPVRRCHSPWRVVYVDADGGVSGCFRVEAPSSDNGDWTDPDIWNSEYFRRARAEQTGRVEPKARCETCVERRGTPAW